MHEQGIKISSRLFHAGRGEDAFVAGLTGCDREVKIPCMDLFFGFAVFFAARLIFSGIPVIMFSVDIL